MPLLCQNFSGQVGKILLHLLPGLFKQLLPLAGKGSALPQAGFQADHIQLQLMILLSQAHSLPVQLSCFILQSPVFFSCLFHTQGNEQPAALKTIVHNKQDSSHDCSADTDPQQQRWSMHMNHQSGETLRVKIHQRLRSRRSSSSSSSRSRTSAQPGRLIRRSRCSRTAVCTRRISM